MPENAAITAGSYRPTQLRRRLADAYPAPAPASTGATSLSVFDNTNPQGTWQLFVVDDLAGFAGDIIGRLVADLTLRTAPYPSPITVTGLPSRVTDVNVTLGGLTHTFPGDLDFLLVGPGGQQATIMSDAGGSSGIDLVDLTLDDEAAAPLTGLRRSRAAPTGPPTSRPSWIAYPPPAPASTGTDGPLGVRRHQPQRPVASVRRRRRGRRPGHLEELVAGHRDRRLRADRHRRASTVGRPSTNSTNVTLNLARLRPGHSQHGRDRDAVQQRRPGVLGLPAVRCDGRLDALQR